MASEILISHAVKVVEAVSAKGSHNRYAHRTKSSGALGDDDKALAAGWSEDASTWKNNTPPTALAKSPRCEVWVPSRKLFQVDCAGLVRRLLQDTHMPAYEQLLTWIEQNAGEKRTTDRPYPRAQTFFCFAEALAAMVSTAHWIVVDDVKSLQGGDVVVWKLNAGEGHTGQAVIAAGSMKVAKHPARTMEFPLIHSWKTPAHGIQRAVCKQRAGGDWALPGFHTVARLRPSDMRILRLRQT